MPSSMIWLVDVDHVRVTHLAAIDDVGHLHARLQLVALHSDGEDPDVAGFHVVGDFLRKRSQRTRREIFQYEGLEGRAQVREFMRDAGRDLATSVVGDQRDFFARLNAEAGVDGVMRAGRELGVKSGFGEIGENGLNQDICPFVTGSELLQHDAVGLKPSSGTNSATHVPCPSSTPTLRLVRSM